MERVIKFRVWASNNENPNGKMYFCGQNSPFLLNLNGDLINVTLKEPFVYSTCWARIGNSDINIQQFTGLLDKNGKEIYEGDILANIYESGAKSHIAKVFWCNKYHSFRQEDKMGSTYPLPIGPQSNLEIIGNIFENPDLLT